MVATNIYRGDSELFIEEKTIYSAEGTTQGDPLAMSIYGIAILPPIKNLQGLCKQLWDASAGGKIEHLREWWLKLKEMGPAYGYYPNLSKTWLLVKEDQMETASEVFTEFGINITPTGQKHLGSALGSDQFFHGFVTAKIATCVSELLKLCEIAKTEPQVAYSALTHGLIGKWTYLMRTTPGISPLMSPLEETLRNNFIPIITGRKAITDEERALLALPCRNGG